MGLECSLSSATKLPGPWCRSYNYIFCYIWLNDKTVREVLGIRQGTKENWVRCNESLSYTEDLTGSLEIHRNLINYGYRVLIYSGDHDMVAPYVGTLAWIESLNLIFAYTWSPWFVDGQVAGYSMQYQQSKYTLTFATVKNGGHTAPEYKPKQCLAMVNSVRHPWFLKPIHKIDVKRFYIYMGPKCYQTHNNVGGSTSCIIENPAMTDYTCFCF